MRGRMLLLLLGCAGLAWLALQPGDPWGGRHEEADPWALAAPAETGPPAAGREPVARLVPVPRAAWAEQVARPLFAATRRPPPPATPAAVAAPVPEPPPPVAASGVVLRPDGALALLRLADDRVVRAQEGEAVEGWQVVRITPAAVELARKDQTLALPTRLAAADGLFPADQNAGTEADAPPMSGGGRPPGAARPARRGPQK